MTDWSPPAGVPGWSVSRPSRPELRIGDEERDGAIAALGEHFAAGRLSQEEFDERSSAALVARTRGDLDPLLADLPETLSKQAGGRPRFAPAFRPVPAMGAVLVAAVVTMVALVVTGTALVHAPWVAWLLLALFLFGRGRRRHAFMHPPRPPQLTRR